MTDGALILSVNVRHDPSGVFYANSPDLRGLHVCGYTLEQVQERVVKSIKAIFFHARKLDVQVFPVSDSAESFPAAKSASDKFVVHRA